MTLSDMGEVLYNIRMLSDSFYYTLNSVLYRILYRPRCTWFAGTFYLFLKYFRFASAKADILPPHHLEQAQAKV